MGAPILTVDSLARDLRVLGLRTGDGVFVHASMRAIGPVIGGARSVIEALQQVLGRDGLIGMPGFSGDASFPPHLDRAAMSEREIAEAERAVPGFDRRRSATLGMGVIAETFRTWPGTERSDHPNVSICLNGRGAAELTASHSRAWATGPDTPLGRLCDRPATKILLIGVDWTRCTALHTAEARARHRRTKLRRFKSGPNDADWVETHDVADDLGRLFPAVGAAFEAAGRVHRGRVGAAECRLCDLAELVGFAAEEIDAANRASGDLH
ncbi:SPBc2 prophage-derived aminoglycoside N(3')-acetyltransferase-like protein YokD [Roseivivax jejudonensis]|uniref:Aminoglycoside N(3)-acetyltransferase n=1 Tax=Roseivivax jejudonensis TaxID=1529041 RepID=A0A1X6YVZ5_9RHOB|nr:AAC(3) family N-acetyltransferase [Roseivivax jejudonensis]SLN32273.1 SPBc2 prophage-derived aminoglycoside N(3')-acetyltransferase-like protein YokD [Roseivivax jejudonensis]